MFRVFTRLAFSSPEGARNKTCNNPNNLNLNPSREFLRDLLESRVRLYATHIFDNLQGITSSKGACDVRFAKAADGWAAHCEAPAWSAEVEATEEPKG